MKIEINITSAGIVDLFVILNVILLGTKTVQTAFLMRFMISYIQPMLDLPQAEVLLDILEVKYTAEIIPMH